MNNKRDILRMIDFVKECYIENDEEFNLLNFYTINNGEYILSNEEAIEIIEELIKENNIDVKIINDIFKNLLRSAGDRALYDSLNNLQKEIRKYVEESIYDIKKYKEVVLLNIQERNSKIIYEINRYDSFKNNQNKFDNMISLLKILNRLEALNIKIHYDDLTFNTSKDETEILRNKILSEVYKSFNLIRFIA